MRYGGGRGSLSDTATRRRRAVIYGGNRRSLLLRKVSRGHEELAAGQMRASAASHTRADRDGGSLKMQEPSGTSPQGQLK